MVFFHFGRLGSAQYPHSFIISFLYFLILLLASARYGLLNACLDIFLSLRPSNLLAIRLDNRFFFGCLDGNDNSAPPDSPSPRSSLGLCTLGCRGRVNALGVVDGVFLDCWSSTSSHDPSSSKFPSWRVSWVGDDSALGICWCCCGGVPAGDWLSRRLIPLQTSWKMSSSSFLSCFFLLDHSSWTLALGFWCRPKSFFVLLISSWHFHWLLHDVPLH